MAKSVRPVYCRFVAKPSLSLEVFAGTGRSKQVKWAIMRTSGIEKQEEERENIRGVTTSDEQTAFIRPGYCGSLEDTQPERLIALDSC
jgi:hypothetical protein